jgi:hypothetical protein
VGRQNSIQAPVRSGSELRVTLVERRMLYVALLLGCLRRAVRPRSVLLLENPALRQQLAVYQRRGARPRISPTRGAISVDRSRIVSTENLRIVVAVSGSNASGRMTVTDNLIVRQTSPQVVCRMGIRSSPGKLPRPAA